MVDYTVWLAVLKSIGLMESQHLMYQFADERSTVRAFPCTLVLDAVTSAFRACR